MEGKIFPHLGGGWSRMHTQKKGVDKKKVNTKKSSPQKKLTTKKTLP